MIQGGPVRPEPVLKEGMHNLTVCGLRLAGFAEPAREGRMTTWYLFQLKWLFRPVSDQSAFQHY